MITVLRTDSGNTDFQHLVRQLDAELKVVDGEDHTFYSQFNRIDALKHAVVAYRDGIPVGCGALKTLEPGVMEIKRMFTLPEERGKGVAGRVLTELETWAKELSCTRCMLETGRRMPDAIALYNKHGYTTVPNYGQYTGVENSICFEKSL